MKPYILNYSQTIDIKPNSHLLSVDTTRLTETIEQVDEDGDINTHTAKTEANEADDFDELLLSPHSTFSTESTEPNDDEELRHEISLQKKDGTVMTFTVEAWDEDEISLSACLNSTLETRTIETSDDDELRSLSTVVTETLEPVEDDDVFLLSTFQTNTTENADDEIILGLGKLPF